MVCIVTDVYIKSFYKLLSHRAGFTINPQLDTDSVAKCPLDSSGAGPFVVRDPRLQPM